MKGYSTLNLKEYIKMVGGDEELALMLGVSVRAVQSWRYGTRKPRAETALVIAGISGMGMEEIYGVHSAVVRTGANNRNTSGDTSGKHKRRMGKSK